MISPTILYQIKAREKLHLGVWSEQILFVTEDLEDDTDLLIDLLCSTRKRFDALKAAEGGHTKF